jgi:conjugal transfer mating pair stabilization protein TraG
MPKKISSFKRRLRRLWRSKRRYALAAAVFMIAAASIVIERNNVTANYTELLSIIAQGESKGNYNAYFGNATNTELRFTDMTVAEVLIWQKQFVEQGSPSNAVGKYQFIRPTLAGLVRELDIDESARFDAGLQDRLAIRLLERRGVHDYLAGRISREQLAHNLSKEWAALPRVIGGDPNSSYYAGDGLNHSRVSVDQVLTAIDSLKTSSA